MKRIKWLLVLTLLLVISVPKVYADGLEYYLTNKELNYNYYEKGNSPSTNIKRENTFNVFAVIDGNENNYTLKSGKVTIRWDNKNVELVKYDDGKVYSLANSDFKGIEVTAVDQLKDRLTITYIADDVIGNNKNKLMEFKFKVLDNAKVGVTKIYEMDGETSISCTDIDGNANKCADSLYSELNYNILSSEVNTLSNIKIDGNAVTGFNENTTIYNVVVDTNKQNINIEVTKKDSKASVSGDLGTKSLEYGTNTFTINVTSESGAKRTYSLNINRPDLRSTINTLKTLKLSTGIINFKPEITDYDVTVSNDVSKITITSSLTDSKAKYSEDYTKKEINLSEGINKIQITVIAENGDAKTYNINITRELSGNNTLKELKVNGNKVDLKNNEFYYEVEVENEIERVNIEAVATNEGANIEIDRINTLLIGDNDISIFVTAPNGNQVSYHLNVYRKELLSNDSKLKELSIKGYNLKYNRDTMYYYLTIKNEDTLEIKAIPEDDSAKVEIGGNHNLIDGSVIKITVRAEDNSVTRYFINIEKPGKSNILLWVILLLVIFIIFAVIFLLYPGRKSKKKKSDLEEKHEEPVKEEDNTLEKENVVVTNEEVSSNEEDNKSIEQNNDEKINVEIEKSEDTEEEA